MFYVMTVRDEQNQSHIVGYFSKEKQNVKNYNVSCILVFPRFMGKKYGSLLIDFSYLLTRVEGTVGTPERPLSFLGRKAYQSFWHRKLITLLAEQSEEYVEDKPVQLSDLAQKTGMMPHDIASTLAQAGVLTLLQHSKVVVDLSKAQTIAASLPASQVPHTLDPSKLCWTPPLGAGRYFSQAIVQDPHQ
eukprot:m.167907 g.167907  ORF g.167907 m.167907 type:complete len:189 (-) comp14468_c0_seq4:143-709(-)